MATTVNKISRIVDISNYKSSDEQLITSKPFIRKFGLPEDYIEMHIYSAENTLLYSDYNFKNYKYPSDIGLKGDTTTNVLEFDPLSDIVQRGYNIGLHRVQYNFLRTKLYSQPVNVFFIKEISNDRKEIRIASNAISDSDLETNTLSFLYEIQDSPYYKDFVLNFGKNEFVTAVNIALDKNTNPYSILIKLYEPLPIKYDLNTTLRVADELSESYAYSVEMTPEFVETLPPYLKGPNFDIDFESVSIPSTEYFNINSLYSNSSLSSYQKLNNALDQNKISINIDYTDYSSFVHFSSVKERLLNFGYKIGLIEGYTNQINNLKNVPNYSTNLSVSSSTAKFQNNIDDIIKKFDGYEQYLYYVSSSVSWPKSGSTQPYSLYSTTSPQVISWVGSDVYGSPYYGGQMLSASIYDTENNDNLVHTVPEYLVSDGNNDSYQLFLNMIGQHFDAIWTYEKAVTDLYKSKNNIQKGISKDLVFYALKSLGIKLYNSNSTQNIFEYLLGTSPSGSYSAPYDSHQTLISGSSDTMSGQDRSKELFKRLYHNLPLLLKGKGTARGVKALISCFGISDTIFTINEYGGSDKSSRTLEYSYDRFSYALQTSGSGYVEIPWAPLTQNYIKYAKNDVVADTIEFRFKPDRAITNVSQSLIQLNVSSSTGYIAQPKFGLQLQYSSSNGYDYGNIRFFLSGSTGYTSSLPISLPIFYSGSNDELSWWNVMIKRTTGSLSIAEQATRSQTYQVYVKNNINGKVGHQGSSSLTISDSTFNNSWAKYTGSGSLGYLYLGGNSGSNVIAPNGVVFNGLFQEFRLWSTPVDETRFNFHVLNPESYEGNNTGSAYSDLAARFSLGNNLYKYAHYMSRSLASTHPNQSIIISSGSGASYLSFNSATFLNFPSHSNYINDVEYYYANVPNTGYSNPLVDKIRISDIQATGSVLSHVIRLEQDLTNSITKDIHLLDVSLSPQNEINRDIISQFGNTFTIDDLIGNPSDISNDTYPDLDAFKLDYFKKYLESFNYRDYINLIKYFDNSLFKMLKDFVAARANVSTGITITSPIIERNKVAFGLPTVINQDVHLAEYTKPTISEKYGKLYDGLGGDKMAFFTGDIDGNTINTYDYFEYTNPNPYLGNWDVYNSQRSLRPKEQINYGKFLHSDFNALRNNVSSSRLSLTRKRVEKQPYTTSSLLLPTQLQDSYETLDSYILSRYSGVKLKGLYYNVYTSGSDISYGKSAVINRNSYKVGWVKNIPNKTLNFPDKTSVNLKYLVDSNNNLTELSRANLNLFEVQNIFKSHNRAIVSISDVLQPSNQTMLDGTKTVFKGGYSFDPILFREANEVLAFTHPEPISSSIKYLGINAISTDKFAYIGSVGSIKAPNIYFGYTFLKNNIGQSLPMASAIQTTPAWPYNNTSDGLAVSAIWGDPLGISSDHSSATWNTRMSTSGGISVCSVYTFDFFDFDQIESNTEPDTTTYSDQWVGDGKYHYKAPRTSTYRIKSNMRIRVKASDDGPGRYYYAGAGFKIFAMIFKSSDPLNNPWVYIGSTKLISETGGPGAAFGYDQNQNTIYWDNASDQYFNMTIDKSVALTVGDYIKYTLYIVDPGGTFGSYCADLSTNWNQFMTEETYNLQIYFNEYTTGNQRAYFNIYDEAVPLVEYIYTSSYGQIPPLFTTGSQPNSITFAGQFQNFIDTASVFLPSMPASQYYSPVIDNMSIEKYDLIRMGGFNSYPTYYEVRDVNTGASSTSISINGGSFVRSVGAFINFGKFVYPYAAYTPNQFQPGDVVTVSGTTNNNVTLTVRLVQPSIINNQVTIFFAQNVAYEYNIATTTFNYVNRVNYTTVTLDRTIDTGSFNNGTSFAILRPKPNETSVILNYKKIQEGEVAQSILIPYDGSDTIKNSVGNIFKDINTSIK